MLRERYREHRSRTGRRLYTSEADFLVRNDYPYGVWTCADGREVLFNRFYEPIWQRLPGEDPKPADPHERVKWVKQDYFYDDGSRDLERRARAALRSWGLGLL